MTVGNKEITDLTLVPDPVNTDIYCVKAGVDYRIRTGVAGGMATLGGDAKLLAAQMPTIVVPPQAWSSLTGVPATFTPSAHTHDASDIVSGYVPTARMGAGVVTISNFLRGDSVWANVDWTNLTGKPATFAPSAHTHDTGDIISGVLPIARGGTGTNSVTGTGIPVYNSGPSITSPTLVGNTTAANITLGGGKLLTKLTLSNLAPGTLVDGELYMKY